MNDTLAPNIKPFEEITPEELTSNARLRSIDAGVLAAAYRFCRAVTQSHYENFPVASRLLPGHMRPAIEAVYAFSRTADDFADEKEFSHQRLHKLNQWREFLLDQELPTHPVFMALHDTIRNFDLPMQLFDDLLTAFIMDVSKNRYGNFDEVVHYCKHSANPVGRIVLHLFKQDHKTNLEYSDAICTALQLANFWQDVAVDLQKDRIYLPEGDLERFNVSYQQLFQLRFDDNVKRLMMFQVERTWEFFEKGKPLGLALRGTLGLEIRLTWITGVTILKKIKNLGFDTLNNRPVLTKFDFIKLLWTALSKKRYQQYTL